jgi:hypothetical protein
VSLRAPAGFRFVQGPQEGPAHLIEAGPRDDRDDASGVTGRSLCGVWPGWSPETAGARWRLVADALPEGARPCGACAARLRLRALPRTPPDASPEQLRLL